MTCNGACAVPNAPPRADGHCCDACAREAQTKAATWAGGVKVAAPLMGPTARSGKRSKRQAVEMITVASTAALPTQLTGAPRGLPFEQGTRSGPRVERVTLLHTQHGVRRARKGGGPPLLAGSGIPVLRGPRRMGGFAPAPTGPAPVHGGGHHHGRFPGGLYPLIEPAVYLDLIGGYPCAWWWRLSPQAKLAQAIAMEEVNPGSTGGPAAFIARMNAHCARQGLIVVSGDIVPSGAVTWADPADTYYTYATDGAGNTVDLNANGLPIPGSVADSAGNTQADSTWTGLNVTVGGQGPDFYRGGDNGGGSAPAAGRTPSAADTAAWSALSSLITAAGTDLNTVLHNAGASELATINAQLQEALHSGTSDQQAAAHQLLNSGLFAPPAPAISTPVAVVGGGVALAILLKLLDVI